MRISFLDLYFRDVIFVLDFLWFGQIDALVLELFQSLFGLFADLHLALFLFLQLLDLLWVTLFLLLFFSLL